MNIRYTVRMKSPDLTGAQRLELVAWLQSGSRQYADLCGYGNGEIQSNIRTQIDKYAGEFGRILRGEVEMSDEDDPLTLRTDLYGLKKSSCPASGLVELMLASTSDFGVTIPDLLFRAEILDDHSRSHKNLGFATEPPHAIDARDIGPMICGLFVQAGILRAENFDEQLAFYKNLFFPTEPRPAIKIDMPRSPLRVKRGIPLSIQFMQAQINRDGETRASRSARDLALFYLLLKHFGYGHEALTRMLRTMQHVRRRVPPVADYLQTRGRDIFSVGALQRRVCRFFKSDPASEGRLQQEILQFLSMKRKTFLGEGVLNQAF